MKHSAFFSISVVAIALRAAAGCSANDGSLEGDSYGSPTTGSETSSSGGTGGGPGSGGTRGGFSGEIADIAVPTSGGIKDVCNKTSVVTYTMSADDSNSMGSPGYAREMLNAHKAPEPALLRTYEFLNYYDLGYPEAPAGGLTVTPQILANPKIPGEYRLQIAVRAPPIASPRRPMSLTFVVDTSQSMVGQGLTNAKAVIGAIAGNLALGDAVSVVTLDAEATALLDGRVITSESDKIAVSDVAKSLHVTGAHDLQGGLVRGYSKAFQNYNENGINRVILITDGRVNPSSVDMGFVSENAKSGDEKGIYLVGVAAGPADGYNDALLNQLTDAGRGAYVYVDTEAEAARTFGGHFSEVMDISARSVSVTLTLPDYMGVQQYYGEAIAPSFTDVVPQHLGGGDTMVFNMVLRSCTPALLDGTDTIKVGVSWRTPVTLEPRSFVMDVGINDLLMPGSGPMLKANAVIAYAEALKSLDKKRLEDAYCAVKSAYTSSAPPDAELDQIRAQILNHPALDGEPVCP